MPVRYTRYGEELLFFKTACILLPPFTYARGRLGKEAAGPEKDAFVRLSWLFSDIYDTAGGWQSVAVLLTGEADHTVPGTGCAHERCEQEWRSRMQCTRRRLIS